MVLVAVSKYVTGLVLSHPIPNSACGLLVSVLIVDVILVIVNYVGLQSCSIVFLFVIMYNF